MINRSMASPAKASRLDFIAASNGNTNTNNNNSNTNNNNDHQRLAADSPVARSQNNNYNASNSTNLINISTRFQQQQQYQRPTIISSTGKPIHYLSPASVSAPAYSSTSSSSSSSSSHQFLQQSQPALTKSHIATPHKAYSIPRQSDNGGIYSAKRTPSNPATTTTVAAAQTQTKIPTQIGEPETDKGDSGQSDDIEFIGQFESPTTKLGPQRAADSQPLPVPKATYIKMKSRPKKNERRVHFVNLQSSSSDELPPGGSPKLSQPSSSTAAPIAASAPTPTPTKVSLIPKPQPDGQSEAQVAASSSTASNLRNGETSSPQKQSPTNNSTGPNMKTVPLTAAEAVLRNNSMSSASRSQSSLQSSNSPKHHLPNQTSPQKSTPVKQNESHQDRPATNGHPATEELHQTTKSTTQDQPQPQDKNVQSNDSNLLSKPKAKPPASYFSWDLYLELSPAVIAPREAFMQGDPQKLKNEFKYGMKLEARDPRNPSSWCLATVFGLEGLRLRLRFDGSDSMNDFFELIDSDCIRPVGSKPDDILVPPMAYKGNHSSYPKFIEKILTKPDTVMAPASCFVDLPPRPDSNLFKPGMKLEAIDRKNPHLICPATVGEISGADIKIIFDGWRGSFDYTCSYYSREIFPVNWCRDTNHYIATPNGWEALINRDPENSKPNRSPISRANARAILTSTPKHRNTSSNSTPRPNLHQSLKAIKLKPKITPMKISLSTRLSPIRANKKSPSPKSDSTRKSTAETEQQEDEPREPLPTQSADISPLDEDLDVPTNGSQFQCQRTVPYGDWLKSKSDAVIPDVRSEASFVNMETHNTMDNLGESSPLAATLSDSSTIVQSPQQKVDYQPQSSTTRSQGKTDASSAPESRPRGRPKKIRLENPTREELPSSSNSSTPQTTNASDNNKKKPLDQWTVSDVLRLIRSDDTLVKYSEIFENHEIDGKAFVLLTTDVMVNHMGLKIGPVLKINNLIEQVRRLK